MKKIIITFSFFAMLSTVACDTSGKATTTQVAASASQTQTLAAPVAIPDSVADFQVKKFQAKKAMKAKSLEMAPPEKTVHTPAPVKQ